MVVTGRPASGPVRRQCLCWCTGGNRKVSSFLQGLHQPLYPVSTRAVGAARVGRSSGVTGGVIEVVGQFVVVTAVGLYLAVWFTAAAWSNAGKRRDAGRYRNRRRRLRR